MEDYTTPLCFKAEKYHDFAKYFSSLFLLHKTSSYPALMSTVILIFDAAGAIIEITTPIKMIKTKNP